MRMIPKLGKRRMGGAWPVILPIFFLTVACSQNSDTPGASPLPQSAHVTVELRGRISDGRVLLKSMSGEVLDQATTDSGGVAALDSSRLPVDSWGVVSVQDGVDGATGAAVAGTLHAVATRQQLERGIYVSALTELTYILLRDAGPLYGEALPILTNRAAARVISTDVNDDGVLTYDDVLALGNVRSGLSSRFNFPSNMLWNDGPEGNASLESLIAYNSPASAASGAAIYLLGSTFLPAPTGTVATLRVTNGISGISLQPTSQDALGHPTVNATDSPVLVIGSPDGTLQCAFSFVEAPPGTAIVDVTFSAEETAESLVLIASMGALSGQHLDAISALIIENPKFTDLVSQVQQAYSEDACFLDDPSSRTLLASKVNEISGELISVASKINAKVGTRYFAKTITIPAGLGYPLQVFPFLWVIGDWGTNYYDRYGSYSSISAAEGMYVLQDVSNSGRVIAGNPLHLHQIVQQLDVSEDGSIIVVDAWLLNPVGGLIGGHLMNGGIQPTRILVDQQGIGQKPAFIRVMNVGTAESSTIGDTLEFLDKMQVLGTVAGVVSEVPVDGNSFVSLFRRMAPREIDGFATCIQLHGLGMEEIDLGSSGAISQLVSSISGMLESYDCAKVAAPRLSLVIDDAKKALIDARPRLERLSHVFAWISVASDAYVLGAMTFDLAVAPGDVPFELAWSSDGTLTHVWQYTKPERVKPRICPRLVSASGLGVSVSMACANDHSSRDQTSSIDFGDGTQIVVQSSSAHTYANSGTYTIQMQRVDDRQGVVTTGTLQVAVGGSVGGVVVVPSAPLDLSAAGESGQVSLSWSTPTSNGGAVITGYKLYRGATSSNRLLITSGGCASLGVILRCSDTGLTNGQSYNYVIKAVNSVGEGAESSAVTATPIAPLGTPSAPPSFIATAGNGVIGLGWTAPTSNGGSAITGYKLYRGTTSSNRVLVTTGTCANMGGLVRGCSDTGLTNGQSYNYVIKAVNSVGEGVESSAVTATPIAPSASSERITNGGFESGSSGWQLSGDFWAGTTLSRPRTGVGYASGGVTNAGAPKINASGSIYQAVNIPSTATSVTLSFWLNVTSDESTTTAQFDKLYVEVLNSSGSPLATLATYSNLDEGLACESSCIYLQKSFNLNSYKGQSIRIQLRATTDSSSDTIFRIDDISLMSDG